MISTEQKEAGKTTDIQCNIMHLTARAKKSLVASLRQKMQIFKFCIIDPYDTKKFFLSCFGCSVHFSKLKNLG